MKRLLVLLAVLSLLFTCGYASSEDNRITTVDGVEIIEYGEKDAAKYLLQIDIISSVIVGYAENDEVVYIASNNADGYAFLEKHDAVTILGEPINAAIGTIMLAAHEDGCEAEELDVAISYVGEGEGHIEDIMQISRQAAELCDFDIKVTVEEENEIVYSAETGIDEPAACHACHGEGVVACEDCNGKGERMVIVQREKEVRNGYVCEICGGKGWIDDGKHGGEKGNCDSCGGMAGKMPSGDFRKKAYDLVMVDEEEMRFCDHCNGSGSTECAECNGTGELG